MLACPGMIEPIKAQKIELIEEEGKLSSGVHSYISGKKLIESRFSELVRWHEAKRDEREAS